MLILTIIIGSFFTALVLCWMNGLFSEPRLQPLEQTPELITFIKALDKKYN